jgi:hypothetical protein
LDVLTYGKIATMIHPEKIYRRNAGNSAFRLMALLLLFFSELNGNALASYHYTDRQMDALAVRVGKTFWLNSPDGKLPGFVSAPSAAAPSIRPGDAESFVITELAGRSSKNPYYTVKFESGKVGYIRPELFHEALNLTILSADPRADAKEKAEERESEEKKRIEWIQAQPWSPVVKQAAIKKQPTPGLNTGEVKRVLGAPQRITNLRGPIKVAEEHWFYPDGSVLIFHNNLLSKVDKIEKK